MTHSKVFSGKYVASQKPCQNAFNGVSIAGATKMSNVGAKPGDMLSPDYFVSSV